MNEEITQIKVTLELIAESIGGLSIRMDNIDQSISTLATRQEVKDEVKNLQQQFSDVRTTVAGQAIDFKKHIDGLTLSIDDLPTRTELNNVQNYLEGQIDDLAITMKNEFDRIHIRLGDMEKYTVEFRYEFDQKVSGFQSQLDNVYGNYPNREEYTFLNRRVKRIEKVVFA